MILEFMFIVVINKYITWSVCVCIVVINKYNSISVCVCGGLFKITIYVKIIIERFSCVRKNYFDSDISNLFRVREVCKLFRSMIELFPPNQQYNICYVLICIQNNSRTCICTYDITKFFFWSIVCCGLQ